MYNLAKLKDSMTDKMLKFVEIGQQTPPKRKIGTRKEDFKEIYDEFFTKKPRNSRVGVLNVEYLFVKYTVL